MPSTKKRCRARKTIEHRDQRHHRGGHDQSVFLRVLGDEHADADLDGLQVGLGQVDQRTEEVVPGGDEREDRQCRDCRHRQRQHDPPPDAVFAHAVDPRRLAQLVRDRHVELAHQEHAKGGKCLQADQRHVRVVQPELPHHQELRHHVDLPGHGDGGDIGQEERVPVREAQLGERVGGEARRQQLQDGDDHRQLGRVVDEQRQRDLRPDVDIVLPARLQWNPCDGKGEHIPVQLERSRNHPHERRQHGQRDQDDDRIGEDQAPSHPPARALERCRFHHERLRAHVRSSSLLRVQPN